MVELRSYWARLAKGEVFTLAAILVGLMAVMAVVTHGATVSASNLRNILIQSSIRGVAAVGEAFVLLTAGIDVSVGGVAVFVGVIGAVLMAQMGIPIALALLLMLLLSAGIGSFSGFCVSNIRMNPLVVTLALWIMAPGAAYLFTHGTTLSGLPPSLSFLGLGDILTVPMPVIIFGIVAVVAHFVLADTTFGRSVYATGTNDTAARLSGIKTTQTRFLVYTVSGFCAGISAIIVIARIMCASNTMISGLELDAIASCVIGGVSLMGGKGSVVGLMIGVLIIGVVDNSLRLMGVTPALVPITKGGIILLAVMIDALRRR